MQNGLERCCRAVILKVLPTEGKKHIEGKGQHQTIGRKKGNTPGVELWGTRRGGRVSGEEDKVCVCE